jgi:tryptophanyl-tRNA synthetase
MATEAVNEKTEQSSDKKVLFSGIQPSGIITIGNYVGAIKNWIDLQNNYDSIFCIVDLHAITVRQEPAALRANTLELLALYLACGINPDLSTVFLQSHVSAHAELAWILNTVAYVGELNRMTQYKDKSKKHVDNINMGLMDYPVLMASDILLYKTDLVPVGADQKQHLELARDLALRFNARYSDTFTVPDAYIPKIGSKIMSLQDAKSKMSKSDENENAYISMTDSPDVIRRKFKRAVTDSDTSVRFSREKPEVSNLLSIYSAFSGLTVSESEREFENAGYGEFKSRLADAVIAVLEPIQKKQRELLADKTYLNQVLKEGAQKANYRAQKILNKVYKKVGFVPKS